MSLSTCEKCGGNIPLGPKASNQCEKCGHGIFTAEDQLNRSANLAALAEIAALKKELEELRPLKHRYSGDILDEQENTILEMRRADAAENERDALRGAIEISRLHREALAKDLEIVRSESFERGQRLESVQIELDKARARCDFWMRAAGTA